MAKIKKPASQTSFAFGKLASSFQLVKQKNLDDDDDDDYFLTYNEHKIFEIFLNLVNFRLEAEISFKFIRLKKCSDEIFDLQQEQQIDL